MTRILFILATAFFSIAVAFISDIIGDSNTYGIEYYAIGLATLLALEWGAIEILRVYNPTLYNRYNFKLTILFEKFIYYTMIDENKYPNFNKYITFKVKLLCSANGFRLINDYSHKKGYSVYIEKNDFGTKSFYPNAKHEPEEIAYGWLSLRYTFPKPPSEEIVRLYLAQDGWNYIYTGPPPSLTYAQQEQAIGLMLTRWGTTLDKVHISGKKLNSDIENFDVLFDMAKLYEFTQAIVSKR